MNGGRTALVGLIRECGEQVDACGPRAAMYDIRQENGQCFPIGEHGLNFGSQQWHLGFAAGVQWVQMRLEGQVIAGRTWGDEVRRIGEKLDRAWHLLGRYELTENEELKNEAEQLFSEVRADVSAFRNSIK